MKMRYYILLFALLCVSIAACSKHAIDLPLPETEVKPPKGDTVEVIKAYLVIVNATTADTVKTDTVTVIN